MGSHMCTDNAEIPTKWQETLKCRKHKQGLTQFLSAYIVQYIRPLLRGTQKYMHVTSGATDNGHAVEVTKSAGPSSHYHLCNYVVIAPQLYSVAHE